MVVPSDAAVLIDKANALVEISTSSIPSKETSAAEPERESQVLPVVSTINAIPKSSFFTLNPTALSVPPFNPTKVETSVWLKVIMATLTSLMLVPSETFIVSNTCSITKSLVVLKKPLIPKVNEPAILNLLPSTAAMSKVIPSIPPDGKILIDVVAKSIIESSAAFEFKEIAKSFPDTSTPSIPPLNPILLAVAFKTVHERDVLSSLSE